MYYLSTVVLVKYWILQTDGRKHKSEIENQMEKHNGKPYTSFFFGIKTLIDYGKIYSIELNSLLYFLVVKLKRSNFEIIFFLIHHNHLFLLSLFCADYLHYIERLKSNRNKINFCIKKKVIIIKICVCVFFFLTFWSYFRYFRTPKYTKSWMCFFFSFLISLSVCLLS